MRRLLLKLISILLIIVLAACNTNPGTSTRNRLKHQHRIFLLHPVWPRVRTWCNSAECFEEQARVYYEIFVRSFADSDGDGIGDIKGLTENWLPERCKSCDNIRPGITGIWLMPVNKPFHHGYDVTGIMISIDYGTLDDFEGFLMKPIKEISR